MSFSGPMVGNARFKKRLEGLGVKVLRVVNMHDLVPKLPVPLLYSHVGIELELNHKDSTRPTSALMPRVFPLNITLRFYCIYLTGT